VAGELGFEPRIS